MPNRRYATGARLPCRRLRWTSPRTTATTKVTAALPGMTEREVVVSGDMLTLKGEKKQKNFYMSERFDGSFQRSFYVPESVSQQDRPTSPTAY
jgi:HSP20 family molecular chaperone IbpA